MYVCNLCRGLGEIWTIDGEDESTKPCPLCVAKGFAPFVMAKTPEDEAIIQALRPEPVKEEVEDAGVVQVVSGSSQV